MLQLEIEPLECYDEKTSEFYYAFPWDVNTRVESSKVFTVQLEHSLLSLSKWEEKWQIPFLTDDPPKTNEQIFDYIRCMSITKNLPPHFYELLPQSYIDKITAYIDDKHTATWFSEDANKKNNQHGKKKQQIVTAELIYYWMIAQQIPWDPCEKWHLNKLMTLIRVCSIKNQPPEKKSKQQLSSEFARVKAARRAARAKKK